MSRGFGKVQRAILQVLPGELEQGISIAETSRLIHWKPAHIYKALRRLNKRELLIIEHGKDYPWRAFYRRARFVSATSFSYNRKRINRHHAGSLVAAVQPREPQGIVYRIRSF